MKRVSLLIAMICAVAMPMARADILLEPFVGYGFQSGDLDMSGSGTLFGARAGIKKMGLFGALEYSYSDMSGDYKNGPVTVDYDSSGYLMTAIAGYEFPALLRAWGGYIFMGENDDTSGFALGVGFKPFPTPIPMMDVYINGEFKAISNNGSDSKIFAITVSIPITI